MESFDAYAADSDGYTGFDSFRMAEDDERVYSEDHHFTAAAADEPKELGEEDEVESYSHGYEHHVEVPPSYQSTFDDDDGLSSAMSFDANRPRDFAPSEDFSPSMVSNGKGFGHPLEVEDVVYGFPPSSAGSVNGGAGLAPPEELDGMYGYPPQSGSFNGSAVLPPSEELDGMYGFPPQSGSFNGSAVLPPPEEMQAEEGFLLREWRRVNAIHLEEKSRTEREKLSQIIDAADVFKYEFYEKRRTHCETTQKNNREKEKVFLESNEKFHATADRHYWKAIGELIPNEMPSKEVKSRGNKDKKKPNVVINQGPKPGKPTDLSRMRQVLLKLKHNAPAHMKAPIVSAVPIPAGMEDPDAMAAASAAPQIQASIQAVAGA